MELTKRDLAKRFATGALALTFALGLALFAPAQAAFADAGMGAGRAPRAIDAVAVQDESPVADPVENGDYRVSFDAVVEASGNAYALSNNFDPNIKLVKSADGMTLSLLYPATSMELDSMSLNGEPMDKAGVGTRKADGSSTVYEYSGAIETLTAENKLTFSYSYTIPGRGTMQNEHTLLLTTTSIEAWPGDYANIVRLGSADTVFPKATVNPRTGAAVPVEIEVPVAMMNATDTSEPSMADVVESPATVSVDSDGNATVALSLKSMTVGAVTAYPTGLDVYQGAEAAGDVVAATAVETEEVSVDGQPVTVPTKVSFTVPAAALSLDGVYVQAPSTFAHGGGTPSAFLAIAYAGAQPIYRLYNQWSHEHLLTGDKAEYDRNVELGWTGEDVAWYAPGVSAKPVYRLFNPYSLDHLWTTEGTEKDDLVNLGWIYEKVDFYSETSEGGTPVYRLFNPWATEFTHHYTADEVERQINLDAGWTDENVGFYGLAGTVATGVAIA